MTKASWSVAALALAVGIGSATVASADDETGVLAGRHVQEYETPQRFNVELRFSPYHPTVDDDPALGGAHPYSDAFGTSTRWEVAGEFDWEALRIPHVGTLGPGFGFGYTKSSALAKAGPAPAGGQASTGAPSENTDLAIFPFYLVAVLRADVVMRELKIPFVPYVKGGLGMALWRAYNDGGTSCSPAPCGRGHTVGTQVALGLSFDMNVLDRTAARNFDNALGVNHTYIFGEAYISQLTGLGQAHALYVGNGSFTGGAAGPAGPAWAFGVAVEF